MIFKSSAAINKIEKHPRRFAPLVIFVRTFSAHLGCSVFHIVSLPSSWTTFNNVMLQVLLSFNQDTITIYWINDKLWPRYIHILLILFDMYRKSTLWSMWLKRANNTSTIYFTCLTCQWVLHLHAYRWWKMILIIPFWFKVGNGFPIVQ
jgi:hypothetical protein